MVPLYDQIVVLDKNSCQWACVACGSYGGGLGHLYEQDGAFRLWRCTRCGTESWVPTDITADTLGHSEYWDLQRFESYEQDDVVEEYRSRYDRLGELTGLSSGELRKCRLADWGGGIGNLASWATDLGVSDVTVLDTDVRALDVAARRGIATVEVDRLDPHERFDLIFAIDVIEHVVAPADFLDSLARHLEPGGIVVLETPNSGFWMRHLGRREYLWYVGPRLRHYLYYYEHKHYFSVKGLTELAHSCGFEVRQTRLVGSPRSKIAASAFPGTHWFQRALRQLTSIGLAALGRRNKIWMSLESPR